LDHKAYSAIVSSGTGIDEFRGGRINAHRLGKGSGTKQASMFTAKLLGDAVIAVVMLFMTLSLIHAVYREHRRNNLIQRRRELKRLERSTAACAGSRLVNDNSSQIEPSSG
jgi:hypothetical protein